MAYYTYYLLLHTTANSFCDYYYISNLSINNLVSKMRLNLHIHTYTYLLYTVVFIRTPFYLFLCLFWVRGFERTRIMIPKRRFLIFFLTNFFINVQVLFKAAQRDFFPKNRLRTWAIIRITRVATYTHNLCNLILIDPFENT